jgi:hypothetical protein
MAVVEERQSANRALRDNDSRTAREILIGLHQRFPDNGLYSLELNRLAAATP